MYGFGGLGQVEVEEEKMLRDGRTNERTRKDRATQPLDNGRLR